MFRGGIFLRILVLLVSCGPGIFLVGCASRGPEPYTYRHVPGHTGVLHEAYAVAPPGAPEEVQVAVAAGNRITGLPYGYGSGHAKTFDAAYDCSGAVSFLLQAAGKLGSPMPSGGFRRYGERGEGKWISVYAKRGHVFVVVAGLRFDTGWAGKQRGPQWTTRSRPTSGYVVRHPPGL